MNAAVPPSKALRKMYLTIFLRGRAIRGMRNKEQAPRSIGSKLAMTLIFYAFFGSFAIAFMRQSLLALSIYLHATTLMFTGMFVASSAGEALFNKEEGDILLHRPITPRTLLWAKFNVIVQISLWLAGAFNLAGFFVGALMPGGSWMFFVAHAISVCLQALFCVGIVVLTYQLCLRWFGRERLDGVITTVQTAMSVLIMFGSQLAPRFMMQFGAQVNSAANSWWVYCLPPAWFAGIDDAIAGSRSRASWIMAGVAVLVTGATLRAAFGTLAGDYSSGLQTIQEHVPSKSKRRGERRWIDRLVKMPPFSWWLRDSVARAAFLLSAAYMVRDRDVKLRVYPGLAPILIMPILFLMPQQGRPMMGEFGLAFAGMYLGFLPMMGLSFLKYSQQWQAAEIFRAAPLPGPGALCAGARKAMLCLLAVPLLLVLAFVSIVFGSNAGSLRMLLPGLIALPVFAMVPTVNGEAVPLSQPAEEAKQAGRGMQMIGVMIVAMAVGGIAILAEHYKLFWLFLILETAFAIVACLLMQLQCKRAKWEPLD